MKLDDLDDLIPLRNYRRKAIAMLQAAKTGYLNCELVFAGEKYDPATMISMELIRAAYVQALTKFIADNDAKIAGLGVEPPAALD